MSLFSPKNESPYQIKKYILYLDYLVINSSGRNAEDARKTLAKSYNKIKMADITSSNNLINYSSLFKIRF